MSTLHRLLVIIATVDLVAFVAAFAARHAKHGVAHVVGDVAWFAFAIGLLLVIVLAAVTAIRSVARRRSPIQGSTQ
jgi:hypothetical protein